MTVDSQLRSPQHSRVQDEMEGLVMSDDFETITTAVGEAFTRQDAEGIARYYTDDAQILPPDAPLVQDREGFIAMLNATSPPGAVPYEWRLSPHSKTGTS